jgi:CHAT domain-containing protein
MLVALPAMGQEQPRPLGENLAGEACELATVQAVAPVRLGVFCAGVKTPAAEIAALDRRAEPKALMADLALRRAIAPGLSCTGEARALPIAPGIEAEVMACTAADGGWQRFVLAARRDRGAYFASGNMASLDATRRAIALHAGAGQPAPQRSSPTGRPVKPQPTRPADAKPEQGDVRQRIAELEAAVGGSLSTIGVADADRFNKLRELGNGYNSLRDYSRAEDAWRRALDIQERAQGAASGGSPAMGDTLGHLALNVANQRRFAEAGALFARAEPLARRSGDPDHYPRLLVYRAFGEELQGRLERALDLAAQATALRRKRPEARDALGHSLYAEAGLAMRWGDLVRADRAVGEARGLFEQAYGAVHWWVAEAIELQGEIAKRAKRLDEARKLNAELAAMRETLFGPSRPLARAYAQGAEIEQAAGRPDAALAAWRRMTDAVVKDRRARAEAAPEEFMGFVLAALRQSRADGRNLQALADEAFRAAQVPRAGAAAQAIAQMSARLSASTPALAALTRELQDGYGRLDGLRRDLAAAMSKPAAERAQAAEDDLKRRIAAESAAIDALDKRLQREFPDYAQLQSPEPAGAAALARLLKPGEALAAMLSSEQGTVVFLLRDGRIHAHAVSLSSQALDGIVRELRRGLDWTKGQRDFDLELSHRLYRTLFEPLEPALVDLKHLILVPAGPMLALPPAALVAATPASPRGYAEAQFLIRRFAVSIVPSVDAFRALRAAKQAPAAPEPFIGFGAPSFAGASGGSSAMAELGAACRDRADTIARLLRLLDPLPDTAGELRAMARALKAPADSVVLAGEATETRVRRSGLDRYRVVAFATHGLLPGDLPCDIEPSLALTPPAAASAEDNGLLDASEIAALRLNADFVILSACNTAAPDGRLGGESLGGLTRAFFYAGARSVYASSFPVPSEQTAELTAALFAELAADAKLGRAEAARRAQLKLWRQRDIAHPVFWSGFVLIGD